MQVGAFQVATNMHPITNMFRYISTFSNRVICESLLCFTTGDYLSNEMVMPRVLGHVATHRAKALRYPERYKHTTNT